LADSNRFRQVLLGKPRDVKDPGVFHHTSLVAFLAWVGLGADGLSSSAYGPDEAFRALGSHHALAIALVAMTAVTIAVISVAYSNLIEHFPGGGGGYLVATKLLGEKAGVVSGCALLAIFSGAARDIRETRSSIGFWPLAFILLRAYSMGGGTYTGIEAVSNGVTMLREPRVKTGKRTMFLMAASLAFTAGGILFGYLLVSAHPQEGKTMNFVLFDALFGTWRPGGLAVGTVLVLTLLVSEAALLFVAARTGFLDGPRVLGNMAVDSWVPHRFAQLSDRLVTQNGVFLMGLAAVAALLYTRGDITMLVVMYSINVFVTFSLTELGMARHWIADRRREPRWKSQLAIHRTGLVLCVTILGVTLYEKFEEGGWMTTVVTSAVIGLCFLIRGHYNRVRRDLKRLDDVLVPIAPAAGTPEGVSELDPRLPTAILTVDRFSGYGLHQILSIHGLFPGYYRNIVFVSVAVVDSGSFKGSEEVERLEAATRESLERYVAWARAHGWNAAYRMAVDTEAVEKVIGICAELAREFPRSVVFSGKLVSRKPRWYDTLLHNETVLSIQRHLQAAGVPAIVLPVRAAV
jgi:amino acid transporter